MLSCPIRAHGAPRLSHPVTNDRASCPRGPPFLRHPPGGGGAGNRPIEGVVPPVAALPALRGSHDAAPGELIDDPVGPIDPDPVPDAQALRAPGHVGVDAEGVQHGQLVGGAAVCSPESPRTFDGGQRSEPVHLCPSPRRNPAFVDTALLLTRSSRTCERPIRVPAPAPVRRRPPSPPGRTRSRGPRGSAAPRPRGRRALLRADRARRCSTCRPRTSARRRRPAPPRAGGWSRSPPWCPSPLTSSGDRRAGREPVRVRGEFVAAGGRAEEPGPPVADEVRGRFPLHCHPADRIRHHLTHRAELTVL